MQKRKRLGSYVLAIKNILTIVFAKKRKEKINNLQKMIVFFSTKVNKETETKICSYA